MIKLHHSAKDLTGRRFGRLVAIEPVDSGKNGVGWRCQCDCGSEKVVRAKYLIKGTQSCGCLIREATSRRSKTHGSSFTPEYRAWSQILTRCGNQNQPGFADYGGRGIKCKFRDYKHFVEHVGPRPSSQHSIDRIDNDGHYEPGNVRWATKTEQSRNRRGIARLCYMGVDHHLSEWAEILGVRAGLLYERRLRGWSPEEILYGKAE